MLRAVVLSADGEGLAFGKRERGAVEERAADAVGGGAWAYRVEAERAEDVPGRGLAGVLVAAQAIRGGLVKLIHDQAGAGLSFPGLPDIVVEVNHVMDGLVAVGVLAHVERGHLDHLVYGVAIGAGLEGVGRGEDGVELGSKGLVAAQELDEAGDVLHHAPGPVPGTAFGERTTPLGRVEGLTPGAFGLAPAHEAGLRVEEVGVVHGLAGELLSLGGAANGASELRGAEVVVGIFEGLGRGLGEAGLTPDAGVRDITELIVILGAVTANGAADIDRKS